MKKLFFLLVLISLISCNSQKEVKSSGSNHSSIKAKRSRTFSPPSPLDVAKKFLVAYRDKNMNEVKSLAMPAMAMNFSEENFDNKIIEKIKKWDGNVEQVKYTHVAGGLLAAAIPYYTDNANSISLLQLTYLGKKWMFGMEGFATVSNKTFNLFFDKIYSKDEVKENIVGTWKCTSYIVKGEDLAPDCEGHISFSFNNDKKVTGKYKNAEISGKYKVDDYAVILRRLERSDKKWTPKKRTLIFKDSKTLVMLNERVKAAYTKQ